MFTPVETSLGAVLLHQATSVLLFQNGCVLGASGFLRRILSAPTKGMASFFAGMAISLLPLKMFLPELLRAYPPVPTTIQAALVTVGVGALVGWGTKASNGCTSGHMLCGLSRLSGRSIVAVSTFFPVAMITHHLAHPSLLTDVCEAGVPCYTPTYPSTATIISLVVLTAGTILAAQFLPPLIDSFSETDCKFNPDAPARLATQFFSGLEFALGLHITGMASPGKVLSFLSFPNLKAWDPSMGLVIIFGILPNLIEIQAKGFTQPPCFNEKFELPKKTLKDTDWKFVLGAAIFGLGWGLTGTCPGPAVLRSFAQPTWGLLWMSGFWLGGQVCAD
ncbi:YeeE/YedE family integral membrane protein-like protein [Lindgomyces ingoldianus]|uniref:YeeE/YedE family integral membrane protein-like protein n=1 Tax=Lindgomyces ingoldianus TaxID=673940 RepID=A0ACB6QE93_9PLEO|nr:YeeE/YedE family integral membrane protein-like protein [Lindgomyces ingoldianus]KAF2464933.1 YeeE/YedE family integral membrane protein-like protein [Lindgomyces ingoldianus]